MADAQRKRGGRAARRARITETKAPSETAVQPGMQGGRYAPLSTPDMDRIHEAALELLEDIGLSEAIPSCIERVCKAGGRLTKSGRLLFPRHLIEKCLDMAARNITLHGQDRQHDLHLSGNKVYFGTAGAAVHIADPVTRDYRQSTLADLYDITRLVDNLEHIHFLQRPLVARDLENPLELDVNTCYACVSGTRKHVGTSFVSADNLEASIKMLHRIAGGEAQWRARPFVSCSNCFVVPPMRFAQDACTVLESSVKHGLPVLLLAAGQAGATSPAALAGAIVQEVAEVLAGLAYVNLIKPGHPAIFGAWPFVSDLRTGAMSGGSGEQAVLMAACGQMGRYYDLPTGIAAGMADAKLPDVQSGYEKGYTNILAGHSGANLIYESAGMQASLLGCCYESYVIDNDMLGAINRTVRGIEITDETLSIDVIGDVCSNGPNHFLGHAQTLALMNKEYLYPYIGDRSSPKEWSESGSPDIIKSARIKVEHLLATHFPDHIPVEVDNYIRQVLPIRLPKQKMYGVKL